MIQYEDVFYFILGVVGGGGDILIYRIIFEIIFFRAN